MKKKKIKKLKSKIKLLMIHSEYWRKQSLSNYQRWQDEVKRRRGWEAIEELRKTINEIANMSKNPDVK